MRFGEKITREGLAVLKLESSESSGLDGNGKKADTLLGSAFDQSRSVMDVQKHFDRQRQGVFGLAPARSIGGFYEFTGPAYVHGIMHGEVMSASTKRPSFQEFCIR